MFNLPIYKLILILICAVQANAQINYQFTNFCTVGDKVYKSNFNADPNVDFYVTGANYNWDYSMLVYSAQDSTLNYQVSQTPFAYQLFFNNIFLYPNHFASFAQRGMDINNVPNLQISDRFDFFATSNSSLTKVGFGANINGLPASIRYDTLETIFQFPLSFGDVDSTRAYYLASVPSLGTYGQWIRRSYEVDGWGTLQTPYQTYDVIRVKTILKQRDTIYVDQFQFGTTFDQPDITILQWFSANEKFPVLEVSYQSGFVLQSWYLDQLHVGQRELETEINCYPNPANDFLIIDGLTHLNEYNIKLLDAVGNQIHNCNNCEQISLNGLHSGIYFVSINVDDEMRVFKLFKH